MALQVRAPAALPEDPVSVLSTHIGLLTNACNSSSMESNVVFWLHRNYSQLIHCARKKQITSIILLNWNHRRCHICHSTLKKSHQ